MDQMMIERDRNDQAKESQKRDLLKQKVLEAKQMRDQMIHDAQKKRKEQEQVIKSQEHQQAIQLQQDLVNEKNSLKKKRELEREQARLVIQENEEEKKKRLKLAEEAKKRDADLILKEMHAKEQAVIQRENEIKERDAKIQKIMSRMGDVEFKNDKELIRRAEQEYIQECLLKDEQARQQDLETKLQRRRKNIEMLHYLETQVSEKKQRKIQESDANRQYIVKVREQEQALNQRERDRLLKLKQDAIVHAEFIKSQMTKPVPLGQEAHLVKKFELGGMMNAEEARMNKALLIEIASRKKQQSSERL